MMLQALLYTANAAADAGRFFARPVRSLCGFGSRDPRRQGLRLRSLGASCLACISSMRRRARRPAKTNKVAAKSAHRLISYPLVSPTSWHSRRSFPQPSAIALTKSGATIRSPMISRLTAGRCLEAIYTLSQKSTASASNARLA